MSTLDVETFYGRVRFREDGMNDNRELPIIQIQNGSPAVLYPSRMQQGTLQLIKQ